MKALSSLSSIAVVALLATTLPAQAQQRPYREGAMPTATPKAVGGPLKIIYRVSGVRDNAGADSTGVATSFHCTSGSAVAETLRIGVLQFTGTAVGTQQTVTISPNNTVTMSTHRTLVFTEDRELAPGASISQGSAFIQATSTRIFCSAMIVDAAATVPQGIALHMVRFDPALGSQE